MNERNGSLADITAFAGHVRSTPTADIYPRGLAREMVVHQDDRDCGSRFFRPDTQSQNLFFLDLTSANTCAAGLPDSPTAAATAGTSARRNGFAAFSCSMVVGMVGSPALTCAAASFARAASARLSGSMVCAKRMLAGQLTARA